MTGRRRTLMGREVDIDQWRKGFLWGFIPSFIFWLAFMLTLTLSAE